MRRKILQIMPAVDWFAIFREEGRRNQVEPLVAWALIEDDDVGDDGTTNGQRYE